MYKKILVEKELPPVGKFVTTIDEAGEHRVYRLNEDGTWFMRDSDGVNSPSNNLKIIYWLKGGNYYLLQFHLSINRRDDNGWGRLRLVFAASEQEALQILIKTETIPARVANIGLAFGSDEDIVPDNIICLNI